MPASESNLKSQELLLGPFQTTNRAILLDKRGLGLPFGKGPGTQSTTVQSTGRSTLLRNSVSFPDWLDSQRLCALLMGPNLVCMLCFEGADGSSSSAFIPSATRVHPWASTGDHGRQTAAGSAKRRRVPQEGPQRIAPVFCGIGQLVAPVEVLQWRSRLACADGLGLSVPSRLPGRAAHRKDALCWVVGCVKVLACG